MGKPGAWRSLEPVDVLAIHELLARYGHVVDERDWDSIPALFTADARYDMSDFGLGVLHGAVQIRELWTRSREHPLAHHATNLVVSQDPDGTVRVVSKGIGVGHRGRVGSVTYRDVVQRTTDGWRIAERVGILRRPAASASDD
jgi:hypothetical protein